MKLIGIKDTLGNVMYLNVDKIVTIKLKVPTLDDTTNVIILDNGTEICIKDEVLSKLLTEYLCL